MNCDKISRRLAQLSLGLTWCLAVAAQDPAGVSQDQAPGDVVDGPVDARDELTPAPVDSEVDRGASWERRLAHILNSRSADWQGQQLKQFSIDALRVSEEPGQDRDLMLRLAELAQWSLHDDAAAKQTSELRRAATCVRHSSSDAAKVLYESAAEYSRRGLDGAAMFTYRQVIQTCPDDRMSALADQNIGVILRRTHRFQEAEAHFLAFAEHYAEREPEYARRAHFLAGDCAWRARDPARALQIFADVARVYPETPEGDNARHMTKDIQEGEEPQNDVQLGRAPARPPTRKPAD